MAPIGAAVMGARVESEQVSVSRATPSSVRPFEIIDPDVDLNHFINNTKLNLNAEPKLRT
jgi:hypothetical protein